MIPQQHLVANIPSACSTAFAMLTLLTLTPQGACSSDVVTKLTDADVADAASPDKRILTPTRTLSKRPLFGDMPIGNRLVDPQFDLVGGVGWYSYTGTAETASGVLSRVFFARTPMQQPALKMSKGSTTTAYAVLGMFSGSSAPMQVSVWLGRQQRDDDSTIKYVAASVLGFFAEADAAMSLHMDTTTAPVLLDGMRWQRFVATLVPAPIGPAFLYVEDGATSDLYMSSPIAIDIESSSTFMAGGAPVLGCETRALSTSERSGLDAVKHALQRFTHAPTPQPAAAWPERKKWGHPDAANNQVPK